MRKRILLFVFALVALNVSAKEGLCDFIHCVDEIYYQYIDGAAWVSRKAHYGYEDEVIWDNNCYSGFYGCDALKEITCLAVVPPACGNWSVFRYVDTDQCKLLVPGASIDAYKAADVWKDFFNIETRINSISAGAETRTEWFDLRGRGISAPQKGLNIIRQNGTVKKMLVK